MDFRNNQNVAKVQERTDNSLVITPAGVDPSKRGDRAMRFEFDTTSNTLPWTSSKGSVSDTCYDHCTALVAEAKAAGITVIEE